MLYFFFALFPCYQENQVRISSSCALASFCVLMPFNGTHAGAVSSDVLSATVLTADPTGIASDASRRESASIMFAMGSARLSESSPSPMKAEDCFFSVAYPPFLNVVSVSERHQISQCFFAVKS